MLSAETNAEDRFIDSEDIMRQEHQAIQAGAAGPNAMAFLHALCATVVG